MMSFEEFKGQIRQALENLHDFAFLQQLQLVQVMSQQERSIEHSVRRLRMLLLDAIERLAPARELPQRAKERRPYALLYGRYVQGMSTEELVEEVAISVRQLRREHKRALATVVDLLWEELAPQVQKTPEVLSIPSGEMGRTARQEAADAEAGQLIEQATMRPLSLPPLLASVIDLVTPVAAKHSRGLVTHFPETLPLVYADRVMLRQALVGIFTFAVDRGQSGTVESGILEPVPVPNEMAKSDKAAPLRLYVRTQGAAGSGSRTGISMAVSAKLLQSMGGSLSVVNRPDVWEAQIELPVVSNLNILVIDDNRALVKLFRRYLADYPHYHILEAANGQDALHIAQQHELRLIILDVMIPEQDGWEILQLLRSQAVTSATPVAICSVLNEPEIASALGASDYLTKPVTQDGLLALVDRWCTVLPVEGAMSPAGPPDGEGFRLQ